MKRHQFVESMIGVPIAALYGSAVLGRQAVARPIQDAGPASGLKTSLNAYSFNASLAAGSMTLEDLLEFCALTGFDAVDLTAYYFPGYPQPPADDLVFHIKRKAFRLGLDISGTGVRNDFTYPDVDRRKKEVALVKQWVEVAAKLGAPVLRIFAGKQDTAGYSLDHVADWMVKDIRECVEHGRRYGVIVAIQNHNDFIKTADEALRLLKLVDSEWCGLILDTGSFRAGDPYAEIAIAAPFAVNWQVKEQVFVQGVPASLDLQRLITIIRKSGYRGYLPIETLAPGEPREKVPRFLQELKRSLSL